MPRRYAPPLQLSVTIVNRVAQISELLGRWAAPGKHALSPRLRKDHRLRTIQATLAIENNTLSLEQVTAVIAGKRVLAPPREIHEVRNAYAAYERLADWNPASRRDLLRAHRMLMSGLMDAPGRLRSGGVGIYRGERLVHMAPPASRVGKLVDNLLDWLRRTDLHPLVASCAFHYELEFIHPFADGNGRLGRLWQTLILSRWQPVWAWLPVETLVRDSQRDYYAALAAADRAGDATTFVEFMLRSLHEALSNAIAAAGVSEKMSEKLSEKMSEKTPDRLLREIGRNPRVTIAELAAVTGLSTRTVERNLRTLQERGLLRRAGGARGGHWETG